MSLLKWSSPTSVVMMTTALDSLGSGAVSDQGTEFDNSVSRARWGLWTLEWTPGSAPTGGKQIELFIMYAADGTNYPEGANTGPVTPSGNFWQEAFIVRGATGLQRLSVLTPLLPFKLKPLLLNTSGVAFPSSGNTLTLRHFTDELV